MLWCQCVVHLWSLKCFVFLTTITIYSFRRIIAHARHCFSVTAEQKPERCDNSESASKTVSVGLRVSAWTSDAGGNHVQLISVPLEKVSYVRPRIKGRYLGFLFVLRWFILVFSRTLFTICTDIVTASRKKISRMIIKQTQRSARERRSLPRTRVDSANLSESISNRVIVFTRYFCR